MISGDFIQILNIANGMAKIPGIGKKGFWKFQLKNLMEIQQNNECLLIQMLFYIKLVTDIIVIKQ